MFERYVNDILRIKYILMPHLKGKLTICEIYVCTCLLDMLKHILCEIYIYYVNRHFNDI